MIIAKIPDYKGTAAESLVNDARAAISALASMRELRTPDLDAYERSCINLHNALQELGVHHGWTLGQIESLEWSLRNQAAEDAARRPLTDRDWEEAYHLLNASNSQGLVRGLVKAALRIGQDAEAQGIAWGAHPIVRLYVDHISQLVMSKSTFGDAYEEVQAMIAYKHIAILIRAQGPQELPWIQNEIGQQTQLLDHVRDNERRYALVKTWISVLIRKGLLMRIEEAYDLPPV